MDKLNINLLKNLCTAFSVTSDEDDVSKVIQAELKRLNVKYNIDSFGNILAGNLENPKVAIASHMDEVGVMVKKIKEDGLLEFVTSGYIHPATLLNSVMELKTPKGFTEGYILSGRMFSGGLSNYELKQEDILIDIGAKDANEALKMGVKVGTLGTYKKNFVEKNNRVIATCLDNSVGMLINLMLLSQDKFRKDCVFLFHRMEEWGSFGAEVFEHSVFAPYTIVLDYTPARVGSDRNGDVNPEIDKGPSVVYWANGYTIDNKIKQLIELVSKEIPFQPMFTSKSTEVEHFQNLGSRGVNICVPARGFHGAAYVVSKEDIIQTYKFVELFTRKLILL